MTGLPKVTVFVTTYNHERFIAQALESVLAQQAPFDFSVVVLEDCSTDRTREILRDIGSREPQRVRLVLADRNVCSNAPLARELSATRSPYAAFLDGDDFWTSPDKLRKQVDFLDRHPGCAICYHEVTILLEDGSQQSWSSRHGEQRPLSSLADLLTGNLIPGPSPMLRRHLVRRLPEWFDHSVYGDWPLYMLYAQHGGIAYLPDDMATYRFHRGGIWTGLDELTQCRQLIGFLEDMEPRLDESYHPILRRTIRWWESRLEELAQPAPQASA